MSNIRVNTINDANGGSAAVLYGVASPPNSMGFRNRIINGDMRIDQRNAGASVTAPTGGYSVDRWATYLTNSAFSAQQASIAPVGFSNSLLLTTTTAGTPAASDYRFLQQAIEGLNVSDLGWGTANAQPVTLSFWVRSSLTGTFGGSLKNSAENRSYPFTFSITSANTFEYKTVTVSGDTAGTWLGTNGIGIRVCFDIGSGSNRKGAAGAWASSNFDGATGSVNLVGTNGATFYITGVQLEAGTVASPFERRDYGRELMMCQRYFEKSSDDGLSPTANAGQIGWTSVGGNTFPRLRFQFKVPKRATPILTVYDTNGNSGQASTWNNGTITSGAVANVQMNTTEFSVERQDGTVLASRAFIYGAFAASAEL